jgi:CRISPR-associated protein Csb2
MFGIAVELLCGRYTATQFNDRTKPEWPPHPARLLSAMVAAWADSDAPDAGERAALQWLEDQDPPSIRCGPAQSRRVVTHFVPVNDATALTRDVSRTYATIIEATRTLQREEDTGDERRIVRARTAAAAVKAKAVADAGRAGKPTGRETDSVTAAVLGVLPEHRGKQGRSYPTVIPDEPAVWFLWPGAEPTDQQRTVLDRLLGRVGRIGHSSTLVTCRCVDDGPAPTWVPGNGANAVRLRVPRAGLVDRLEKAFATHRGEEPRTLPAGMVYYRRPEAERRPLRSPLLGGDWYVLGITGRRLPAAVQSLAITRAARSALLAHGDQPAPEILSGHKHGHGDGGLTPPLDRPHLAVVPLLNAGNPHSDGAVFGLALVLPTDCQDSDRELVENAARSWAASGFELLLGGNAGGQPVRLVLEDLGIERADTEQGWTDSALTVRRKTTRRDHWCRPAQRWVSVTPIALDRFPGDLRSQDRSHRERAEAEAAASIARACVFAGLADFPEDVQVEIRLDSPLVGLPASPNGARARGSRQFPRYQTGAGVPRASVHAEIRFAQPVHGPVLVGAGRYLGYGLCLPREMREELS